MTHAIEASSPALDQRAQRSSGSAFRSEVLLVERHRLPKGSRDTRRLADVYVYDYDADQLSQTVVDLDSNRADSVAIVQDAQLPLTEAEVSRALALTFADQELGDRIRAAHLRITGQSLEDPSQLRVSGFVYRADSMPASRESAVCGRHRCAQLLLRTTDEVALELPIVDLSTNRVLDSRSFGMNRQEREAGLGHSHDALAPGHDHGE